MKKILSLFLLLQCWNAQAAWVVVAIENKSDLSLVQAVRSGLQDDVAIQSISKKIEDAGKLGQVALSKDDAFGTVGGCKIIAKNPRGEKVLILFVTDPTHRVANGRARHSDIASRSLANLHNKGMMARVVIQEGGIKKVVGLYGGYEQENQPFKLVLQGSSGNYHVEVIPVN